MFQLKNVGNSLKKHRKKLNLTQGELAARLFVSTQSISKWERGESLPDISHLCLLSEIFHVSVDVLLGNYTPKEKTLIAVDGGGTKTEFVLVNETGSLLKRVVLAGSNPNIYGIEKVCEILREGIDLLLQMDTQVQGVFVGGSGFLTGGNYKLIESVLRNTYSEFPIFCHSDIRNVLQCSLDPDHCIAVISGTGSTVFSDRNGELMQTGGMGYLFDRAGSGYDMGRDAIISAMEDEEGLGEKTLITSLVQERVHGSAIKHLQEFYKRGASYIASFAPLVEEAAKKGDKMAYAILENNVSRLVQLIHHAAKKNPEANCVILAGSMLTRDTLFRKQVLERISPKLTAQIMQQPQIWGAVLCCARLCGMEAPNADGFLSQYRLYEGLSDKD